MEKTPAQQDGHGHVENTGKDRQTETVHQSVVKAGNAEYAAVLARDPPSPWSRGSIKLYLCCCIVYLCSTMTGYDWSLMGGINALESYHAYYGLGENGAASTGLVFSIFQIGQMAASLFAWLSDFRGRKFAIGLGCAGVVMGTIVTATAKNLNVFIAGRFLLSFFATISTTASALYCVEIAPPMYRGTIAGMYNTLYYMGSIIATFTLYGANIHLSGNLNWRLPLWLQMVCPAFVCIGVWFIPESPRWLVGKDRHEEARAILAEYHANGDATHPIVELEMGEIVESLQAARITGIKDFFDLSVFFKTRARRYRTGLAIAMSWFGQFSGNNIASYYLPVMVAHVGITNTNTQLLLNAIYAITGWIAATTGARLMDVVGRRKMLLGSTIGMTICLAIVTGTAAGYVETGSKASSSASIAFIYVFGVVFAIAFTSMQPIYPAEVLSTDMRAKGMGLFQLTAGAAGFVNTFAAPIALQKIGYWFYAFFVFWDVFESLVIYFFFVETKGRTLEEMDQVFEAKNPRKESTKKVAIRKTNVAGEKGLAVTLIEEI